MEKVTLHAPGINCMHCVGAIRRAVGTLEGVHKVEADPGTKIVEVLFDPCKVELAEIKAAMAEEGYPVAN